jgi:uncharacterized protein YkwD
VPLLFPGNEVPDPLPDLKNKVTGYPVTVTFPRRAKVTDTEITMEEAGKPVPVHASGPDRPANMAHPNHQANTMCAFAHKVLKPATRYTVKAKASVDGKPWSREWSFTTLAREGFPGTRPEGAVALLNAYRKAAGLGAVTLDEAVSKGCQAHALYLARHLHKVKGLNIYAEKPDLEGYSKEGAEAGRLATVRFNVGEAPAEGIDWLLTSVVNRGQALNPAMRKVGVGVAPQEKGHIWVVNMATPRRPGDGPPVAYPGSGQTGVPLDFGRDLSEVRPGTPRGTPAGFPVSVTFSPASKVVGVKTSLKDRDGNEVPAWVSTPESPLPGTGTQAKVAIIPQKPLAPEASYTSEVSGTVDGKPYMKKWSFTTAADPHDEGRVAAKMMADLNAFRKAAGLGEVELDAELSKGCKLHAGYLEKNIENPKVQGLGIHDEAPELPGFSEAGQKAGKGSVIAVLAMPADAMDMWTGSLYHRIPLLRPDLKKVGYALGRHPVRGFIPVMDVVGR